MMRKMHIWMIGILALSLLFACAPAEEAAPAEGEGEEAEGEEGGEAEEAAAE